MMIIMPTFAQSCQRDCQIFHWTYISINITEQVYLKSAVAGLRIYLLIVWFLAPHVCNAVHEKRNVQRNAKPSVEIDPEGIPHCLVPKVHRNAHGQENSEYEKPQRIQPKIKKQKCVSY